MRTRGALRAHSRAYAAFAQTAAMRTAGTARQARPLQSGKEVALRLVIAVGAPSQDVSANLLAEAESRIAAVHEYGAAMVARRYHGTSAEALSVREHLPEPDQGNLAILAGHIVDRPAMAKAITQLGEL